MDESGTDGVDCSRKVANGRRVAGAIRSLVNARSLWVECAKVLHESLLVPVLTYGSETMIWKERSRWITSEVYYVLGGGIAYQMH